MAASTSGRRNRDWAWHPDIPMPVVPLFDWPWRPMKALRYLLSVAFMWSQVVPFAILAIVVWEFTQPALERCRELEAGWIAWMYLRNLGLMILVAGGLHLFFHTFRAQGGRRKFDSRDLARSDARFFTGNQTRDNIFWSCTSGVGIWTAYEVIMMWGYANGWFPHFLVWHENPVLFVAWFLIIPFWSAVHFYFIHRLLHWKPLFRIAHALHHRNVTVGPWSGLSMHPIEHVIYLSGVFIHAAVLSHPVHVLFHGQYNTLQAASSHTDSIPSWCAASRSTTPAASSTRSTIATTTATTATSWCRWTSGSAAFTTAPRRHGPGCAAAWRQGRLRQHPATARHPLRDGYSAAAVMVPASERMPAR